MGAGPVRGPRTCAQHESTGPDLRVSPRLRLPMSTTLPEGPRKNDGDVALSQFVNNVSMLGLTV